MHYIYVIRNTFNASVYVGKTSNFAKRRADHWYCARKGDTRPLYCAMRELNSENFTLSVLEEHELELMAIEREKFWISHFDSFNNGYNLTPSGGFHIGNKGRKFSADHRRKLSDAHKGKILSSETRQKLSDIQRGRNRGPRSDETKAKIGRAHKGKIISFEQREKIRQALLGRSPSKETCQRISDSNMGRVINESTRQKLSLAHIGIKHSNETRAHFSKIRKGVKRGERSIEAKQRMKNAWKPRSCKSCKQVGHFAKTCPTKEQESNHI